MKNAADITKSQHLEEIKELGLAAIPATDPQVVKRLPFTIPKLSPLGQKIADRILAIENHYGMAYPSHISLAIHFGVTEKTIRNYYAKLRKIGFMFTIRIGWNKTLRCFINPAIKSLNFQQRLVQYLPALKAIFFSLSVLMSPNPLIKENYFRILNINEANRYISYYIKVPVYGYDFVRRMRSNEYEALDSFIKALPFELTIEQKIFLSQFTLETLQYALERLLLARSVTQHWRYFQSLITDYCGREGIGKNKDRRQELLKRYGLSKHVDLGYAKFIDPEKKTRQGERSQPSHFKQDSRKQWQQPANAPGKPSITQQIHNMSEARFAAGIRPVSAPNRSYMPNFDASALTKTEANRPELGNTHLPNHAQVDMIRSMLKSKKANLEWVKVNPSEETAAAIPKLEKRIRELYERLYEILPGYQGD